MGNHVNWMSRVLEEANTALANGDAPVAALVVQDDQVLGVGRNTKTSDECGFAHAELNALLEAKQKLGRRPQSAVLYSTLEPCAMCLGAIIFSGIRTVVYGADDSEGGAVAMFNGHRVYRKWMPEVIPGVFREECEALKSVPAFKSQKS